MTSVYITSNPLTGATGSKARYRMLGTLIGAAGTIVLVPNLVGAPELLSLAIAFWFGVFLYFFAYRRHPTRLRIQYPRTTAPTDTECYGLKCDGTGPASRQLQDKVGGVAPAGLFSLSRKVDVSVRLRNVRSCHNNRSITAHSAN